MNLPRKRDDTITQENIARVRKEYPEIGTAEKIVAKIVGTEMNGPIRKRLVARCERLIHKKGTDGTNV